MGDLHLDNVNQKWEELIRSGFLDTVTYEAERRYKKTFSYIDGKQASAIVEVGCGTGAFHAMLRRAGFSRVISCDVTLEHILRAKKRCPDGLFVVASGQALPFRDDTFGGLVTNAAIEHFPNPAEGIKEFARVTRKGARLVVSSDCYVWRYFKRIGLYRSKMPIDEAISFRGFSTMFKVSDLCLEDYDAWGVTHYVRGLAKLFPRFKIDMESLKRDDHWVNRKSNNPLVSRIKMMWLDENVFSLENCKKTSSFSVSENENDNGNNIQLLDIIVCPTCKGALLETENGLDCNNCNLTYPVQHGVPILLAENASARELFRR